MPSADGTSEREDLPPAERIARSSASVYASVLAGEETADHGAEGDDVLLRQRMAAFFRQSGGPASPKIPAFLDDHLRNAKDHGEQGHLETVEDVFADVVENDPSLKTAMKVYGRWRGKRELREEEERDRQAEFTAAVVRIEEHLGELTKAVRLLLEERATRGAYTTTGGQPGQPDARADGPADGGSHA